MSLALQGIGVSATRAVAIGPALLVGGAAWSPARVEIPTEGVAGEILRLEQAVSAAHGSLRAVREHISQSLSREIAEFIDSHLLMLEDATLVQEARRLIREQRCNAEWAMARQRDLLVAAFDAMDDPYLRTRRDDVEHVVQQVQAFLRGGPPDTREPPADPGGSVVVARDLMPADVILLRHRGAAAFVTEHGGPMSHTAILARGLGVPAVVGVHGATRYLRPGEPLVVDGATGTVIAQAEPETLAYFRQRILACDRRRAGLRGLLARPTVTRDGVPVELLANLELPEDAAAARDNGAVGIGLYRTEFLYMNRDDLPDEAEHLATYLDIMARLGGIPLTIRTLDLGVDKQADGRCSPRDGVTNPALGLRAIRLCLKEPDLFRPQLRAILRASASGPVRLMVPMVTTAAELAAVLDLLAGLKVELTREGRPFDPDLPVGAMVEVPAAALAARSLARLSDFLSIGTNDLVQYTLAIDRLDDSVNDLYDPTHPAILRLVRMTIEAGAAHKVPVAMCGEMAGDPRFTRLLLGMGLRRFSMQPDALLDIKEIVLGCDTRELQWHTARLFARLDESPPGPLLDALNQLGA
jgi:phosphotransferase system enzyme I (PtsI)